MCKFCEQKFNQKLGITCGEILMEGCGLVITKNPEGRFVLSDNEGSKDRPINLCPICGQDLSE